MGAGRKAETVGQRMDRELVRAGAGRHVETVGKKMFRELARAARTDIEG